MSFLKTHLKTGLLAVALAASAFTAAAPAVAHDRRGGDDAAIAIGAGVLGLAIGAAIASDRNDRIYYDNRYYDGAYSRGGYYRPYPVYRRGYAYPAYPAYRAYPAWRGYDRRFDRDRRWHRHDRRDYGRGW
jgi:hypothetical protein